MRRGRVKPSKSSSAMGMVVGVVFVGLGVIIIIPMFGLFGIVWTLVALGITLTHAMNVFGKNGAAYYEIDIEDEVGSQSNELNFDEKLHRLEQLKEEGLISSDEYELKRKEILGEKW